MIDDGIVALIAAIVSRARLDAYHPSGSRLPDGQRESLQQDAIDFLQWVDAQRAELTDLAACAALPALCVCRHSIGGSLRWEMAADERTRKREWARRKREQVAGNNDAGREAEYFEN